MLSSVFLIIYILNIIYFILYGTRGNEIPYETKTHYAFISEMRRNSFKNNRHISVWFNFQSSPNL